MDKKKLLLVAASVGMFLVIVMGGAILVFTPRAAPAPQAATPERAGGALPQAAAPSEGAPVPPGWVPDAAPPPSGVASRPPAPAYDPPSPPAGRDPYGYPRADYQGYARAAPAEERAGTVINVPSPAHAGVPQTTDYLDARAPAGRARTTPAAAPAHAAARPAAAVKPVSAPPAAKLAPPAGSNYWIQTGSYERKSSADTAKNYLSTKGINSIVLNGNVGGKTYYRVRVGPYISQNEADYWLSLIKSIDGMENSQVWKSGAL